MAFSNFVQTLGWWLVPLVLVLTPIVIFRIYRTRPGKRVMDELALWVPVLGLLLRKIETTRFARTLAVLLGAGVDIGSSLDLTADVMQLDPMRRTLRRAREAVMDGNELSEALAGSRRFGTDVIAIINSGEETGKLPESLEKVADDYEEQVAYMVRNMGQLIQPLLMVVLGGIVLFIILAVLLPYISIITSLSR
jgi:type II secretory pathway component PulF